MRKTPKEVYQEYKRIDTGSFSEWLGIIKPEVRRLHNGKYICSKFARWRYHSEMIYGDLSDSAKDAKESYRKALFEYHAAMREWERNWQND